MLTLYNKYQTDYLRTRELRNDEIEDFKTQLRIRQNVEKHMYKSCAVTTVSFKVNYVLAKKVNRFVTGNLLEKNLF